MVETHTADGNQDLRAAIQNRWTHVALIDDTGSEAVRIEIANDSRAQWLDDPSSNPMSLEVSVSGSDSDISVPVDLNRTELYDGASATASYSGDDFDEGVATIGSDSDTVTVTHDIEQPQL